ncbi:MAG: hypothetical protein R3B57_15060 [Phycisphaerales bacterium]
MATKSGKKGPRTIAWLSPGQVDLVRAVRDAAGLQLVAVGCPEKGRTGGVADELDAEPATDLRVALASGDAELALLTSLTEFGGAGSQDAGAIEAARARGMTITTLEPIPGSALELGSGGWTRSQHGVRPIDGVQLVPRMRQSRAMALAADALDAFGRVRVLRFESLCRGEHASLGGRLLDAMDLAHAMMGMPETIDAAFVGPNAPGVHAAPGDTLRSLRGDLTINLRFADGRAACAVLSDQAPRWDRSLVALGDEGQLAIDEDSLAWTNPAGEVFDTQRVEPSASDRGIAPEVAAIVDAVMNLLESPSPPPPIDYEALLAMAQAALLSARTGQGESPAMFRRMVVGA